MGASGAFLKVGNCKQRVQAPHFSDPSVVPPNLHLTPTTCRVDPLPPNPFHVRHGKKGLPWAAGPPQPDRRKEELQREDAPPPSHPTEPSKAWNMCVWGEGTGNHSCPTLWGKPWEVETETHTLPQAMGGWDRAVRSKAPAIEMRAPLEVESTHIHR